MVILMCSFVLFMGIVILKNKVEKQIAEEKKTEYRESRESRVRALYAGKQVYRFLFILNQ